MKKGDLVVLLQKVDENWFIGEISGQQGYLPANFVEVKYLKFIPTAGVFCKLMGVRMFIVVYPCKRINGFVFYRGLKCERTNTYDCFTSCNKIYE